MRILLVEDNRELASWLAKLLRGSGYTVDCVYDGEDADHALRIGGYAVVVLDLSLPGLGGIEVLRRLRARGSTVPVIILTANATLSGRVEGLDRGADDYLAKPFDAAELEARIRVQLRRVHNLVTPLVTCGDLVLDMRTREFRLGDAPLPLPPRERAVLEQLVMKTGETVSKVQIGDSIFGFDDEVDSNAIEIYVHRLRKKLEGSRVRIRTLRGLGYILDSHDD